MLLGLPAVGDQYSESNTEGQLGKLLSNKSSPERSAQLGAPVNWKPPLLGTAELGAP
jgi:hypothetical protein